MKQMVIILGFLISTLHFAFGQSSVIYDFKSKNPPKVENATLGQNTVFKVENINRFLYEVIIESKQTEFHSEPPTVFNQVFKLEKKETSSVEKEANKVISDQSEKDKEKIRTKSNTESFLELSELQLDVFNKTLISQKNLPDSIKDEGLIKELQANISKLTKDIEDQKKTIESLNAIIEDGYLKVIQELYSKALSVHNSFELLEESKVLKNRLVGISLTDGLSYNEALEKTNELYVKFPFSNYPENLINSFDKTYKQFKSTYELYLVNLIVKKKFNDDESKVKSSVVALYNEIESLKSLSIKENYAEIFQNINTLYAELRNNNNFSVVSDPVQAEKDVINFEIKITPRKNISTSGNLESRQFTTSVPINGGVKIDFSTGLFITTGLHDRKYSINQTSNDTLKSIISEDTNNNLAQVSLGALMHISPRWSNNFKPGFTFGFGLSTTDISNADIFIGASGIFGTQERFIVSTGLSLAKVDYLKGNYKINTEYTTTFLDNSITEKALRAGWFISFTYNLTNLKKE
ncbi:MAG: hypothetical protein ACYC25_00475 [Paludibacter sp.]